MSIDDARARMIEHDLVRRGVRSPAVLAAMREVPREHFLDPSQRANAYADNPLPIGDEQTISQPYIVALMAEALVLRPEDRVLEVGSGSGYATAVLARLARTIFAIERNARLIELSRLRWAALGIDNVEVCCGDGSLGWPQHAPFDAITVAASAPSMPQALIDQLALGGRLVLPLGTSETTQKLVRVVRTGPTSYAQTDLGAVRFVPLVGAQGWPET